MWTMGYWYKRNGRTWLLLGQDQKHIAQVSRTFGGWIWAIINEEEIVKVGQKKTKRSRKARRIAQRELVRITSGAKKVPVPAA